MLASGFVFNELLDYMNVVDGLKTKAKFTGDEMVLNAAMAEMEEGCQIGNS